MYADRICPKALTASPSVTMNGTRVAEVLQTTKSLRRCNNWRKTQLELLHRKINPKDRFWDRSHETCYLRKWFPSDLASNYIEPRLDYCSNVWGICGITLQDKRQKLQNRAACVLTLSNYDADAGRMVRNFGVEKFWLLAEHTKGHLGIQMSTWISSGQLNFEIL